MLLATLLALAVPCIASPLAPPAGDTVHLTLAPKGGMTLIGHYKPQKAELVAEKPAAVTKVPDGLLAPVFAVLPIGGGAGLVVLVDEPEDKPARFFVDSNRNGDLTDDPACEWTANDPQTTELPSYTMHQGAAMVDIGEPGRPQLVGISAYRFDKHDPAREALKNTLLFYRDYAWEGTLDLGGRSCKVMLDDENASGDFRGAADGDSSGVTLLIDVNGNGKFDSRGESFDVRKPFNVGGTTWELAGMTRDGSSFEVVKSKQTVAEVATPPDLSVGQVFPAFQATDADGKAVNFPADYAGKVVLVDFWATWCGPCMHEMPNVVAAYGKYHDSGFEVQGISLDNEKTLPKMPEVMSAQKMTWRQVADGKGWKAELAQRYAIDRIPATFLVDGTSGTILGTDLRGEALDAAVVKALAARHTQ